jgi:broad specificity phosphatase PhoE
MSAQQQLEGTHKTVLVMVGLPARGKSYIATKLRRYMKWLGKNCHLFNVGDVRRRHLGPNHDHHFFDPSNAEAMAKREEFARIALDDLCSFLQKDGDVALFDATNTTRKRRDGVVRHLNSALPGAQIIFIESICDDEEVIRTNLERKLDNADYRGVDREVALADFKARLEEYAKVYEPLQEPNLSFIKIYNVTGKLEAQNIKGYLPSQIVFFLLNLHIAPREVFISRHGQSIFNIFDKLGGDSDLSNAGMEYARRLGAWFRDNHDHEARPLTIWCSTLNRAVTTALTVKNAINKPTTCVFQFHALNEISAGVCEGMTYAQVRETMPDIHEARSKDKLRFRYPGGGESYLDLIDRLQPLIIELERTQTNVLIIAHQAVVRVLLSYFQDTDPELCPHVEVPLHSLLHIGAGNPPKWMAMGPAEDTLAAFTPATTERLAHIEAPVPVIDSAHRKLSKSASRSLLPE